MDGNGSQDGNAQRRAAASDDAGGACLLLDINAVLLTPRGPCAARHLRDGDRVLTRDRGYQPLRFAARLHKAGPSLRLAASALGPDLPTQALSFGEEVRVWSADLLHQPQTAASEAAQLGAVHDLRPAARVALLCEQSEALFVSGLWLDCPRPADGALRQLAAQLMPEDRARLFQAFTVAPIFDSRKSKRRAAPVPASPPVPEQQRIH